MKVRLKLWPRNVEGTECPFPVVRLAVRDKYGTLAALDFRVDTQADLTTIPVETARQQGISYSGAGQQQRPLGGLGGQTTAYRSHVRLIIAGREHTWPCDFVNVPQPRAQGQVLRELLPVLGRAGFLDEYAVTVDSGYVIITRIGPIRRWLRQRLHQLWEVCGLIHPKGQAV